MAFLDTTPILVRDWTYRNNAYSWQTGEILEYQDVSERIYEWACDMAGGETTHEGTYGTGGFALEEYGREASRNKPGSSTWREIYRNAGEWTSV